MAIWKGRFRTPLHPDALKFSSSLHIDKLLYREDIEGSIAHVSMLAKQKIISQDEAKKIGKALREILREVERGELKFNDAVNRDGRFVAEDIHMAIEHRLIQKIGELGGKLHTARSRNDQIALDERLYLRKSIHDISKLIRTLQRRCLALAERHRSVVMPGYTHLQRAQPILFSHHILAYVSMLDRDHERLEDCLKRVNRSPLGAGALAGTSFSIDRKFSARRLGFHVLVENSIDAVSDRDVQIEVLSVCAITMMHLSRFAEELILWSSQEWRFVELGDEVTTGSSIMPQKKNPDMAELVRGKTGRVYGDLISLLTVMKGLPLAYNRDLQEDKHPLFDAVDTVSECLRVFSLMLKTLKVNVNRFEKEFRSDFSLATELADYLVRKGMPFRKAHAIVSEIVRRCIEKHISVSELSLRHYRQYSNLFENDVYRMLDVRHSLHQKKSAGSTSPKEVQKALRSWHKKLK